MMDNTGCLVLEMPVGRVATIALLVGGGGARAS